MRKDLDSHVVDTHALIWFLTKNKRLGSAARQILNQAEAGEAQVLVPTLVLAELTHIVQKKKVVVAVDELLNKINYGDGFTVVSFDLAVFQTMLMLPSN